MSYFVDLTPYSYYHLGISDNTLNIGWLDREHAYARGKVQDEIVEILWEFLRYRVLRMRGFHICDFCTSPFNGPLPVERNNEIIHLGTSEIRVIGENNKIYAAPDLIYHYIIVHSYKPPDEFLEAVIKGPRPNSKEYKLKFSAIL
ncbi:MAG: hypothetical protein PVG41_05070 [Desulfobacteraceae bacterium]|jgi:hypothetical protein